MKEVNIDKIYIYSENSQLCTGAITLVCIIIFRYVNRHKLVVYLESISEVNHMLVDELGLERIFAPTKRKILNAVILQQVQCFSCMAFITYMSHIITKTSDIPMFMIKYIPLYNLSLMQFICSSFIYVIWQDLLALNKEITKMYRKQYLLLNDNQNFAMSNNSKNKKSQSKPSTVLEKLYIIWRIYAKLYDSSIVLNEYISFTVFTVISGSFICLLFETYKLTQIVCYVLKGTQINKYLPLMTAVEFYLNFINIFMVISACNNCDTCVSYYITFFSL